MKMIVKEYMEGLKKLDAEGYRAAEQKHIEFPEQTEPISTARKPGRSV